MPAAAEKIIYLRQLLAEKGVSRPAAPLTDGFLTGLAPLDEHGVPQHGVTEVVAPPSEGPGGTLLLYGLIHAMRGQRIALIDASDAFDPRSAVATDLLRLLWVRCADTLQAAKATDMVLREGSLTACVFLLTMAPAVALRCIHANVWHRLQVLSEQSGVPLIAFTPFAQIGNAKLRLSVSGHFPLSAITRSRTQLLPDLHLAVEKRRMNHGGADVRRSACA